ncbi:MAG TPA: ATP-binding protein, partial [Gaiellaceae bacterium]|nr:ATP-binding protein [Gaiellaceae bacterium]
RIVQEALSNVRKHAGASSVTVRLAADDGSLVLDVVDDGRGFDPEATVRTGWPRLGLQTMRERAESVGGTFALDAAPGGGTRLRVRVPIEKKEAVGAGAAR